MKKSILFVAAVSFGISSGSFAGIFDSIDSVGVIQAQDTKPANRGPAGAKDESANEEPTVTTLNEPADTNEPNPKKSKNLKRSLSQQGEQQKKQAETQQKQSAQPGALAPRD